MRRQVRLVYEHLGTDVALESWIVVALLVDVYLVSILESFAADVARELADSGVDEQVLLEEFLRLEDFSALKTLVSVFDFVRLRFHFVDELVHEIRVAAHQPFELFVGGDVVQDVGAVVFRR